MNNARNRLFRVCMLFIILLSCRYSGGAVENAPYLPYTVETINDDNENENIIFITYPDSSENVIYEVNLPAFQMRGLYLKENIIVSPDFTDLLQTIAEAGINTIVFDVKEMSGNVYLDLKEHPQLQYTTSKLTMNITELIDLLHSKGFYVIARVVQFYNVATARKHPELRIRSREGGYWLGSEGLPCWLDPSNPLVQEELLKIIDIVAGTEVDEIQLDYIRFPTDGNLSQTIFYFETEDAKLIKENSAYKKREKRDIITDYVKLVRAICDKHSVKLSADVFGIVAWQRAADIKHIGQDITYLSPYLHRIHPMLYSSHFSDDLDAFIPNFKNRPYRLVKQGIELAIKATSSNCEVVPYLQAFSLGVNFTQTYIVDQLKAAKDTDVNGYLLWNTQGVYTQTLPWVKQWNKANIK